MRRSHSEHMQDYRREHNQEMWDKPGSLGVEWLEDLAAYNLRKRLQQAVMLYMEECQPGH